MKAVQIARVVKWLRRPRRTPARPARVTLSRYIEADLPRSERDAAERHVADCVSCRRLLASLMQTIGGLRALRAGAPYRLSETIVAALPRGADPGIRRVRAAVRYCLQRTQLRLTVPAALLVGAALTVVNQGGMLLHGEIDVAMCAIYSLDFRLTFVAMNVVVVAATLVARRR